MVDKTSYKFTKIYEQDNQLIGLTHLDSRTSKKLNREVLSENDTYKYFLLNKDEILKLNKISIVVSVLESIALAGISIFGIAAIAYEASGGL